MKDLTKRILSFILCGILLFSCTYPAAAAAEAIEKDLPVIHIYGRLKTIYTQDGKIAYKYNGTNLTDSLLADTDPLVEAATLSFFLDDWSYLGKEISKLLKPSFEDLVLDENGEIYNGTYCDPYPTPKVKTCNFQINDYPFQYDWRLDPIALAGDLDQYIDDVLAATGKDKVHIVARCLGTNVAASYLTFYGASKVDTCVLYAGSAMGILPISTFFSGSLDIDPDALQRYAESTKGDSEYVDLMKTFAAVLKNSTLTSAIFKQNFKKAIKQILPDLLLETYATMPSHWSMVSDEYYEKAKTFVFSGREDQYAGLISKIDNYHYGVQQELPETLTRLKEEGLNIHIFAKYNFEFAPIYENSNFQSDDTIEVSSMSFGAYAPTFGNVLTDDYIAKVKKAGKGKYISDDLIIDASTCLFPDNTWFIKDAGHEKWPRSVYDFILKILQTKKQYTIKTNSKYPQFLQYNALKETLTEVTRYPTLQTVKLTADKLQYTGETIKPKATIIDGAGRTLKEGTDYTLSYSKGCKEIGTYYANINFKSKYNSAPTTLYFDICPQNIKPTSEIFDDSSVLLSWNEVSYADGYTVYKYNESKQKYEKLADVKDAYYIAEKLSGATKYTFAVKAYVKKDDKTYFSPSYGSTSITTKLPVPKLSVEASYKGAVASWKKVKGADGYEIYMSQGNRNNYKKLGTTTETYYNATKLDLYETYYFRVRAYAKVNGKNVYSKYSNVKSAVPSETPATPSVTLKTSARTVEISWNKIPGATGYAVYMATSENGKYTKVGTTKNTSYVKKSLKVNKKYFFKVYAYTKIYDSTFKSKYSAVKSVKTTNTPSTPEIKVSALSKGAKITWSKINGAKGYTVYMATSKNGKYSKIGSTSNTSFKKTGLKKGKTYYFKVKAYSKFDSKTYNSSYSSVKSIKTK